MYLKEGIVCATGIYIILTQSRLHYTLMDTLAEEGIPCEV